MKIECILRRDPPAIVTLGVTAYQFQPDEHGRHVCEVTDTAHLARLLSISEAYRLPGDEPIPQDLIPAIVEQTLPTTAAVLAPIDENIVRGSTVHPGLFDLGGPEKVEIADVVAHALGLSGLTTAEWNSLPDDDRHNFIDLALDDLDKRPPTDVTEDSARTAPPVIEAPKPTSETAPVSDAGNSNGAAPNAGQDATDAEQYAAEREALAVAYKDKFGARPHYKWSIEKITEALAANAPGSDTEE